MKPPAFAYHRPETLREALEILSTAEDAKILAGGQSLIPMMNMRLAHPGLLVDINGIAELAHLTPDGDTLRVGTLVRHHQLEHDPVVRAFSPVVPLAEHLIAHAAIRTRGTIGGSLAHADPAAELPVLATLLDWEMVAASVGGTRVIPAAEFFLSYFITALAPDEMLTEVRWGLPSHMPAHITEYAIRSGDFALAIAAAAVSLDDAGRVANLRMALGGVADVPWRSRDLEAGAQGERADDTLWMHLAEKAAEAIDPADDLHATADYRRHLARTLLADALHKAATQASTDALQGRSSQ